MLPTYVFELTRIWVGHDSDEIGLGWIDRIFLELLGS